MITERRESWSVLVRRHRSLYRFGGPWAQALLSLVPWLNAVVAVALVLAVNRRLAVSPGVVFDLPQAPLREGLHDGLAALMIAVEREAAGESETLVFFDDDRYSMGDDDQRAMLAERLKSRLALGVRREVLLLADKRVPHGDVVRFVNTARESGAQRVSVAEKPD